MLRVVKLPRAPVATALPSNDKLDRACREQARLFFLTSLERSEQPQRR